jgi:1,4-alpha-glucan branching enzyme
LDLRLTVSFQIANRKSKILLLAPALQSVILGANVKKLKKQFPINWPFILQTGTSPDYARKRLHHHLLRFHTLAEQLARRRIDPLQLAQTEADDDLFPDLDPRYRVPASSPLPEDQ